MNFDFVLYYVLCNFADNLLALKAIQTRGENAKKINIKINCFKSVASLCGKSNM